MGNNLANRTDPSGLIAREAVALAQGLGGAVSSGWSASVAAFQNESLADMALKTLEGLNPTVGAAVGAGVRWIGAADKFADVAMGAANFSRELKAADLGIKGTVQELRGTFAVQDGVATVRVDMIRGEVQNPLQVVGNMAEAAKASGATTLRIEGTIANQRLYDVLQRRYGLGSSGATDLITIPLR